MASPAFVAASDTQSNAIGPATSSGANTSSPIDISTSTTTESTTDVTATSVTTTQANTTIIWAYCQDGAAATEADVNTDAGFSGTLRGFEVVGSGAGNGICHAISDATQASAGASATCVFSMNGATEAAVTITAALAPAASSSGYYYHRQQ